MFYRWTTQPTNEGEGYKRSVKNASVERPEEKQKLHGSKTRGSGQLEQAGELECHRLDYIIVQAFIIAQVMSSGGEGDPVY